MCPLPHIPQRNVLRAIIIRIDLVTAFQALELLTVTIILVSEATISV
jgi:hypothetical protein